MAVQHRTAWQLEWDSNLRHRHYGRKASN